MRVKPVLERETGVTLLELILTLFMGSLIVGAVTQFYVSQHYTLTEQMSVSDLQQNVRSAMQEMTDNLRMAGYGMPDGMDPIFAANSNPDTITFLFQRTAASQALLQEDQADPSGELRCDGQDLSDFPSLKMLYIWDPGAGAGEYVYGPYVDYGASRIYLLGAPLSKAYPAGSQVIALDVFKYYVDRSDSLNPTLVRDRLGEGAQVFSEGVADLNIRYLLANGAWADVPPAGRLVRSVEISMRAQADREDQKIVQGKRERALTSRVNIRNLAM